MDLEKPATKVEARQPERQPEGCLVVAIRIPVRIVVLVLVVPVRMVWDGLVVGWRLLTDAVLRPLGRALGWVARAVLVWPFVGLWRYVVVPLGKALGWLANVLVVVPLVWLFRYVLTPLGHGIAWVCRGIGAGLGWVCRGIGAGLGWLYARVLTPVGHAVLWVLRGIGAGAAALGLGVYAVAAWLVRYLVVVPARWLYEWVLTPVGRAVAWCARGVAWLVSMVVAGVAWLVGMVVTGIGFVLYWVLRLLLVLPALALWRWVLTPVGRVLAVIGREVWGALGHAWRIAGYISLAVGRFLGTLLRWIFVEPVRWVYLTVLTPVGHFVRDAVLRPAAEAARSVGRVTRQVLAAARDSARQARADFRRMLFGEPKEPVAVDRREPGGVDGRTLGSSTTALTKD